jgi:transposase InsO family protein
VSPQAYHKHNKQKAKIWTEEVLAVGFAKLCRKKLPTEGVGKIFARYCQQLAKLPKDLKVGRNKFYDICRKEALLIERKRRKHITTDSNHRFHKYPNRIKELSVVRPEQVWCSDITYISTFEGNAYLFLITDHYSKRIVGWELAQQMTVEAGLKALDMALKSRMYPEQELYHHSDRGSQYCSHSYTERLKEAGLKISMTEKGDPYENAIAERVNGTIKHEFGLWEATGNFMHTWRLTKEAVETYNSYRLHMSNGGITPDEMHKQQEKKVRRYAKRKAVNLTSVSEEEAGSAEEQPASSMTQDSTA